MRIVLELDGDEARVIRVLRALLKVLGRRHGVKCRGITASVSDIHPVEG